MLYLNSDRQSECKPPFLQQCAEKSFYKLRGLECQISFLFPNPDIHFKYRESYMKEQPPAGDCSILLCESVQIMFDFTIYKHCICGKEHAA